jgi:hypothetical protein
MREYLHSYDSWSQIGIIDDDPLVMSTIPTKDDPRMVSLGAIADLLKRQFADEVERLSCSYANWLVAHDPDDDTVILARDVDADKCIVGGWEYDWLSVRSFQEELIAVSRVIQTAMHGKIRISVLSHWYYGHMYRPHSLVMVPEQLASSNTSTMSSTTTTETSMTTDGLSDDAGCIAPKSRCKSKARPRRRTTRPDDSFSLVLFDPSMIL